MIDESKIDVMLDMNDPDFSTKLITAIGAKEGEVIEVTGPQFTRTDGLEVPLPVCDFAKMPDLAEETLLAIGCQKWNEPDQNGNVTWLYPHEWFPHLPKGLDIVSITGSKATFDPESTDNGMRFGALSFGFKRSVM